MANSWLRLYHDMPNDPKWRTIAKASKQSIPVVLGVYVHLLIIASGSVDRGTVGQVNSEDLASALDVDSEAVDAVLKAMEGRVITVGKLSGWDKRQTNREDSSTERVKRFREKVTRRNAVKRTVTQVKPEVTADKTREEEIREVQEQKLGALIERTFVFYSSTFKRNPKQYTLTAERRKKAMLRIQERLVIHEGDLGPVEEECRRAVLNLAASSFHREKGYLDWTEQIFRSTEEFEKRINWKGEGNGRFEPGVPAAGGKDMHSHACGAGQHEHCSQDWCICECHVKPKAGDS